jgi:hypothetical protein
MQCEDLTREQADALKSRLRPMLRYLVRLKRRMTHRHFPPGDRLLRAVLLAESAIHELNVEVHYLSCGDVVGRSTKPNHQESHEDQQSGGN